MSFLSIFRRKKNDKVKLEEKRLIKSHEANLNEETKLNINEALEINLSDSVKITDKELIAKIISACPELIEVLDRKNNKSYIFKLPAINGKLNEAKTISNLTDFNIEELVQNGNEALASQVASFINKYGKSKKKSLNADMILASYEISSNYVVDEIRTDLNKINTTIDSISTFLSSEFKSKIEEVTLFLEKAITFKDEILASEDRRKEKISQIEDHISVSIQLFKQAILMVTEASKDIKENYIKYEKSVYEINEWVLNLKTLYSLIRELCKLDYVFYQGGASYESCIYDVKKIGPEISEALLGLANWHKIEQMKLDVNLEAKEHKNTGIKVVIKKFLSRAEDHRAIEYSPIPDEVMEMINSQMNLSLSNIEINIDELFSKEIDLAIVDGDIYYCKNSVSL